MANTVKVSTDRVRNAVFGESFRRAYGQDAVKKILATRYLQEQYASEPNLNANVAVARVQKWEKDYDSRVGRGETDVYLASKAEVDRYLYGVELFTELTPSKLTAKIVKDGYEKFVRAPIEAEWEAETKFTAARLQYQNWLTARENGDQWLAETSEAGRKNPELKTALDILHAPSLGTSFTETSPQKIIDGSPELKASIPPQVRRMIRPDGAISAQLRILLEATNAESEKVEKALNQQLDLLRKIEKNQEDLLEWTKDQTRRQLAQDEAAKLAATQQAMFDGAQSTVYLISTLISLNGDRRLGRQVGAVGNAGIQIGQSILQYIGAAAAFAPLGPIGPVLAGAVLLGGILSSVVGVLSAFDEESATPEQQLMSQIARLQTSVDDLTELAIVRFNRLDKAVAAVAKSLAEGFDRVNFNLLTVRDSVLDLQGRLILLDEELVRVGVNIARLLDETREEDFFEAVNFVYRYRANHRGRVMSQSDFDRCENFLFTWALSRSTGTAATGKNEQRDLTDLGLYEALSSRPVEANLYFLNDWLVSQGGKPFIQTTICNQITWSLAARAYAELLWEAPSRARNVSSARASTLLALGDRTDRAIRSMTIIGTGRSASPNRDPFIQAVEHYKRVVNSFGGAVEAVERKLYTAASANSPRVVLEHNAAAQAPTTVRLSDGSDLPAPNNLLRRAPKELLLAVSLGAPDARLSARCDVGWSPGSIILTPKGYTKKEADLTVDVVLYAGDLPVVHTRAALHKLTFSSSTRAPGGYVTVTDDPLPVVKRAWEKFRQKLEGALPFDEDQNRTTGLSPDVLVWLDGVALSQFVRLNLLDVVSDAEVHDALIALAGSAALNRAFIEAGLARGLAYDEYLRLLLYGTDGLVDRPVILQRYLETGALPVESRVNPRAQLVALALVRIEELRGRVDTHLEARAAAMRALPPRAKFRDPQSVAAVAAAHVRISQFVVSTGLR